MGVARQKCPALLEGVYKLKTSVVEVAWNGAPKRVTAPYTKRVLILLVSTLKYLGKRMSRGNPARLLAKTKYLISPIVNQYREGKVKSSPMRAVK